MKILAFLLSILSLSVSAKPAINIGNTGINYIPFWDANDISRDLNTDGELDINDEITEEYKRLTHQSNHNEISIPFFHLLATQFSRHAQIKGGFTIPLLDKMGRVQCPTHKLATNSNDPIFTAVMNIIDADTQAIYMGRNKQQGDYTYVTYSQIKKTRFHLINGVRYPVSDFSATQYPVFFTLPTSDLIFEIVEVENPFPGQKHSPDKRFGCVPFLNI